ncbi:MULTISPECIES: hypothetical protein [unclassified Saccharopolyspora]|uniref:hypothetical protein n=1 Tax=unclassified Saccharopolyspora TaxID=2646250 RepID=UPI001CD409F7|nr:MULTISPECIES: hypothetical protein [unclassified Saccharopolyspora]MCA1189947.1 hypothetical protein [Saccharopolyspora sp. 6T]MCA1195574.1 hypothetical protein [Saccharopolyspora sp. 6V]MCA1228382.1 hypothetical protein [Saccharopolyspora sp. 6M]MCA1282559.1 hypothetical protein [Saccharopolyspora sp. 7B]
MNAHEALTWVVAQAPAPPADPGGQGEDFGKSSPVGLLLLVLFAIAVAFLIRSMTKHLKKLPTSFDEQRAAQAAPARARRAEAAAEPADSADEADSAAGGAPEAAGETPVEPGRGGASGR